MNSFQIPGKSLDPTLTRLVEGQLGDEEAVALEIRLQKAPEARAYYRTFLAVHLALQEIYQTDAGVIPLPPPSRRLSAGSWLAAAAAVVLAAGGAIWGLENSAATRKSASTNNNGNQVQPLLAVVASARAVAWDLPQPARPGLSLPAGKVRIEQGEIVLTLVNGQTLAIQGPAELELITERELAIHEGIASFRYESVHGAFVVRIPHGAVVTSGGEFSINVKPGEDTRLRAFEGKISASTVKANGRTCEEAVIKAGMELLIGKQLKPGNHPASDFLQMPRPLPTRASIAASSYADAVESDRPLAYWRFEDTDANHRIPDQAGNHDLVLRGGAVIAGPQGRRFLAVDDRQRSGFAYGPTPITGLSTAGFTVECLFYSANESHGTMFTLESSSDEPSPLLPKIHHAPQLCAIERMGRRGEHIGHIHPDYAVRALQRFPAGFEGGTNLYSAESHLLHAWHHVALTSDGSTMRLYLDGRLSDETRTSFAAVTTDVRPVIGRLQPDARDELRQWIGGIDEVAIYPRALDADTIMRHNAALAAH